LERIVARVSLNPARVFPTEELLNHVPLLIDGLADYLERPDNELGAEAPVTAKAMELGALRHVQGFDAYEILKEHEILGGVIFTFLTRQLDDEVLPGTRRDLAICWQRVATAMELIRQATMTHFLRLWSERVREREERLRRFNRMVSHELKNRVGATLGAGQLLQEEWLGENERRRFAAMVAENARAVHDVLDNLVALSRLDPERTQRNIMLDAVVAEVFRQLRELARARQVRLRTAGALPVVEVNAAAVELCLSNYLSNAIKYSDPSQHERWAEVDARIDDRELVVRVRDNGVGVPAEGRARLFERFYRAHSGSGIEGTGLGLNLVRETIESLGGRAWAEFDQGPGAVFAFGLPCPRPAPTHGINGGRNAQDGGPTPRPGAARATAYD
jgi:signal transduction histidine kinase